MTWPLKNLSDITLKIGSGATPLGGSEAYHDEGVSLVRSLNVYDDGFRKKDLAFLDEAQASALSNVELKSGDVLLNITGASIARCCVLPDDVLPARVNQHVAIIRPDREFIDPFFLRYQLISPEHKQLLLQLARAGGSTREALTKAQLERYQVGVPPLPKQQRIVTKLDAAFAALAEALANLERNRANARELFESYLNGVFGREVDSVSADSVELHGSRIQRTWVKLPQVIYFQEGPGLRKWQYRDAGVPFLNIRTLVNERVDKSLCKYLDESEVAQKYKHFLLNAGDIICSTSGTIGKTAVIQEEDLPIMLNTSVVRFRELVKNTIERDYIHLYLRSAYFIQQARKAATGSAQVNFGPSHLKEFWFPICSPKDQSRIVNAIEGLRMHTVELESTYQQKLMELADLKKGLLGAAFRGEL